MRKKTIPPVLEREIEETIINIRNNVSGFITVTIAGVSVEGDGSKKIDRDFGVRDVIIGNEALVELRSASPEWNPSKKEGEYTEADLWTIIDMIENEEIGSVNVHKPA